MKRAIYLTSLFISIVGCAQGGEDSVASGSSGTGVVHEGGAAGAGGDSTGEGGISLGTGGGGGSEEEVCNGTEAVAEQRVLDLIVLLDRSGSMGTGGQWTGATGALQQFFTDPAAAGTNVAVNFFPPDNANDECAPTTYNPPQVPLGELGTGHEQTLTDAMASTFPGGLTPTYGGLLGTLQWATSHQDANQDHVVAVVLATDGAPTTCDTNINTIANLAQSAHNHNGVKTFTVAISGADMNALNQIADKGGTGAAFDVTNNINAFAQKMDEIKAQALGCEFPIPQPENGEFDPTKLNVIYNGQKLSQKQNAQHCGPDGGWYYDDNDAPTTAYLCPASCALVSDDLMATINFEFGCPTKHN